jgi:hypothetical protein
MFYCDRCANNNEWPINPWMRSWGPCEVCKSVGSNNDIPSSYLPIPKKDQGEDQNN